MLMMVPASVAVFFRSCGSAPFICVSVLQTAVTPDTKRFLFHAEHSMHLRWCRMTAAYLSLRFCAMLYDLIRQYVRGQFDRTRVCKGWAHRRTKEGFVQSLASHSTWEPLTGQQTVTRCLHFKYGIALPSLTFLQSFVFSNNKRYAILLYCRQWHSGTFSWNWILRFCWCNCLRSCCHVLANSKKLPTNTEYCVVCKGRVVSKQAMKILDVRNIFMDYRVARIATSQLADATRRLCFFYRDHA